VSWRFLRHEIFALTLAATAQRSGLYRSGLTDRKRQPFKRSLRKALEHIARRYKTAVSEPVHIRNIEWLATSLSAKHANLLASGRMKCGHAQKALNLYLKYLWSIGRVVEPPHFPIDSIILKDVPKHSTCRWTKIKSIQEYCKVVEAARIQATRQRLSLARWELKIYIRRVAQQPHAAIRER
jgi:hypothetical protein